MRDLERYLGGQLTTSYYPPAAVRAALPLQADYFTYGPSKFGGQGLTAKRMVPEGTIFCYEGYCQRREDVNIYTLAVPALSNWGGGGPPGCLRGWVADCDITLGRPERVCLGCVGQPI